MYRILHIPTTLYVSAWPCAGDSISSVYYSIEDAEEVLSGWEHYTIIDCGPDLRATNWIWPCTANEKVEVPGKYHKLNRHEFEIVEVLDGV